MINQCSAWWIATLALNYLCISLLSSIKICGSTPLISSFCFVLLIEYERYMIGCCDRPNWSTNVLLGGSLHWLSIVSCISLLSSIKIVWVYSPYFIILICIIN